MDAPPSTPLPAAGGALNRKLVAWLTFATVIASVNYAATFADHGKTPSGALYQYSEAIGSLFLYAVMLAVVAWITYPRRDLLALVAPHSWKNAAGLVLGVLVLSYVVVEVALEPFLHGGREQGLTNVPWEPAHAGAFVANALVLVVIDPLVEETTFRGLGYSLFSARFSKWTSIVAIGLIFAACHGLVQAFPELAFLGCALAWLRWKTGSVYPAMVVHALFNATALLAVFSGTK